METKLSVALIGAVGYWGQNYLRVLQELDNVDLVCCCDLNEDELKKVHNTILVE